MKSEIKEEPKNADEWYRLAYRHYKDRQYLEAIDCFNEAIKINPSYGHYYYMRGACYQRLGYDGNDYYLVQAIPDLHLAQILKHDRSVSTCLIGLGLVYYKLGEYDEAITCCNNASTILDFAAANQHAPTLFESDDEDEQTLDVELARCYETRAKALIKRDSIMTESAHDDLKKALEAYKRINNTKMVEKLRKRLKEKPKKTAELKTDKTESGFLKQYNESIKKHPYSVAAYISRAKYYQQLHAASPNKKLLVKMMADYQLAIALVEVFPENNIEWFHAVAEIKNKELPGNAITTERLSLQPRNKKHPPPRIIKNG